MPYPQNNEGDSNAMVHATKGRSNRVTIDNIDGLSDRKLQNEIGFCYDALYLADQNGDSRVDADEFVTFVQIMGPGGFLPNTETYQELPLILQSNFIILACLCLQIPNFDGVDGIDPKCCAVDPHISILGTQPGEIATTSQSQYLYQVCFLTETSIDRLLMSAAPTTEVTPKPTGEPTGKPTDKPTDKPTHAPTSQPTDKPTHAPTSQPTDEPTHAPTSQPTDEPSEKPVVEASNEPTQDPTPSPTVDPTPEPTATPTKEPSMEPTGDPTPKPTPKPTEMPSFIPTPVPTGGPTVLTSEPSATPTGKPTGTPTDSPASQVPSSSTTGTTMSPTVKDDNVTSFPVPTAAPVPATTKAMVDYGIAVSNGKVENILPLSYVPDLIKSMDIVSTDVANSITLNESSRFLRKQARKLAAITTVNLPTGIENREEAVCPLFVSADDDCQTVTASVELSVAMDGTVAVADGQELDTITKLFEDNLNTAIEGGALQAALIEVNPNSVVTITTGFKTEAPTFSPTMAPTNAPIVISGGGIAGIVLAGIGGLIIGFLIIGAMRRRGDEDEDSNGGQVAYDPSSGGDVGVGAASVPTQAVQKAAVGTTAVGTLPSIATTSDKLYEVPAGTKAVTGDDASSAVESESGWSSNQDGSSANTSIDASLDSIPTTNFSGIVLGDNIEGQMQEAADDKESSSLATPTKSKTSLDQDHSETQSPGTPGTPLSQQPSQENSLSGTAGTDGSIQSTYSELDEAIQKGDWAAVGVTAALLASQAYTDDGTQGSSKQSVTRLRRANNALNPERAAELDRLVETGDWEGVVAAAAKFDAQEALRGDADSSKASESGSAVDSTGGGSSSALSGSGGESIGTNPSNLSGSQTIDTTHSPSTYTATGLTATSDASTRSKAWKLNEIRDEVEALVRAVVPEEADNVDEMMAQFRGREEELVETLRNMQERDVARKARKENQKQAKRQAKEYMQEKKAQEILEAVDNTGNAADDAWMKELDDAPLTSEKTQAMKVQLKEAIDNENWQNVAEAAAGLSGHSPSRATKDSDSVGSVNINELVDKGDWDGVVAAATRYAESSTNTSSSDAIGSSEEVEDDDTIEQRRKRREERLREEEEALAQAEIWDAIADQTKVEGEGDEASSSTGAAKMAADWAIDQSLAALKKAEEENDDDTVDSGPDKKGDNESL